MKKRKKKAAAGGKRSQKAKKNAGGYAGQIMATLNKDVTRALNVKQLFRQLGAKSIKEKNAITAALHALANEEKVTRLRNNTYKSNKTTSTVTGIVDHVNPRFAYIISEQSEDDIWVRTEDLHNAFDGDTVEVQLKGKMKDRKHPEGRVLKIVQRKRTQFVGVIELNLRYAFVVPDNRKVHLDVYVPLTLTGGAKHKEKVIVEVTKWPSHDQNPEGKVVRVLGASGENETEIHSIIAEFDLPWAFPEEVLQASEAINVDIPRKEIKNRRDLRGITTFTIDPEDAKDFDDALSLQRLSNGNWEVGVHIADVSHYVKPDTLLDEEAYNRATSVYLVDRTIPMLPEKLSNGVCSLRPNEEKLTFSAIFELDNEARVMNQWFGRTIILSDRRFTYEEAQERIETNEGDFSDEINLLNRLAKKLKDARFKKGAINFETVEVKFKLDEQSKPVGIIPKVRKDAHKLIEEFMLLANRSVAQFVYDAHEGKDTFVYRIHDSPDPEKLGSFAQFAKKFGFDLDFEKGDVSTTLNGLIHNIEGKPEQNLLESLAIRTMAKARYTVNTAGHFGLAFSHYTHFTSPIRRYPDVMVHRLLQHYLDKGKTPNAEEYESKCRHSSEMEKRAADAERASIKYKQVEYMQEMTGQVFDGIVSGVTEWGIYVEIIETKCEGMVRLTELDDDYYEFDEENYRIIGRHNKRMITLGDQLKVSVQDTNINKRTIDLALED